MNITLYSSKSNEGLGEEFRFTFYQIPIKLNVMYVYVVNPFVPSVFFFFFFVGGSGVGKQCRSEQMNVWSGSSLFANMNFYKQSN